MMAQMAYASILDVQMRVELQRIVDRLTGRGDVVLAAILTSAVNTLDHRLDRVEDRSPRGGAASDGLMLIETVLYLFGRDVHITIERDFWLLFEELVDASPMAPLSWLEQAVDRQPEETLADRVAPAIRLLVLRRVIEGEIGGPDQTDAKDFLKRLAC